MRASSVPNLYAFCLNKRSCYFCLDGSAFAVDFAILRSHFWYRPPDGPKNGTVKMLFFCSFTKRACSPKNGIHSRNDADPA